MTLERVENNQTKDQSQKMSSSLYGTYADLSKLTSIEEDEDDQQACTILYFCICIHVSVTHSVYLCMMYLQSYIL